MTSARKSRREPSAASERRFRGGKCHRVISGTVFARARRNGAQQNNDKRSALSLPLSLFLLLRDVSRRHSLVWPVFDTADAHTAFEVARTLRAPPRGVAPLTKDLWCCACGPVKERAALGTIP